RGRSACLFCGWTAQRMLPSKPPWWAWWAAYAAVAGCLVRLGAQFAIGFGGIQRPQGGLRFAVESLLFEGAFLLSGIALPLALVHAWGRVAPRWVPLLAGRRAPRWILLGPAFA